MILALLGLAFALSPSDFNGAWVLDPARSDDGSALLAATGASWVERQAAKAVVPTQTITVDGPRMTLAIDASVVSRTEVLVLDGSPVTTQGKHGPTTTTTVVRPDAVVSTSALVGPDGGALVLVATRTLEDGGTVMRQRLEVTLADGQVIRADRVFRRQ